MPEPAFNLSATTKSLIDVELITGRMHQIRRHLEMIGYPVMGDPKYGRGNKNRSGLQLVATRLQFECPLGNGHIDQAVDPEKLGLCFHRLEESSGPAMPLIAANPIEPTPPR